MRIFDILTQPRPEPPKLIMSIIGFLMALGFCLQNARLIFWLSGEYQPVIYLLGCLLAPIFLPIPKPALYGAVALLGSSALIVVFNRATHGQTLNLADLLRLTVGPLMMVGTAAAWNKINPRWLWSILFTYITFAIWGAFAPQSALSVIDFLGIRVNEPSSSAYFPWSAFFYSEYSYAALAFIALYCWMVARKDCQPYHFLYSILLTLLLLTTRSASAIAFILIIFLSQLRFRWFILLILILVASYYLSPRVERLTMGILPLLSGKLDVFIQADPGAAWRFASNIAAFHVLQSHPLGTLNFDLHPYLNTIPLETPIDTMVRAWLTGTAVDVAAQGVAFNFGLFGGWPLFIGVTCVTLFACFSSFRNKNTSIALALTSVCFYALYVQSALTSVTLWLTLGIMLSDKINKRRSDQHT